MSSFIVCQLNPDKYLKRKQQHYITVNYVKLQGEEIFERKSSFTKRKWKQLKHLSTKKSGTYVCRVYCYLPGVMH